MEILSKLVTRQVHSLNIQLGFLKHTNNKFNQACLCFTILIIKHNYGTTDFIRTY